MSDYTLFVLKPAFSTVLQSARSVYGSESVRVEGSEEGWRHLHVVVNAGSSLKLTALQRERPGDKFSKVILGAYNFAKNVVAGPARDRLLKDISETQFLVGVHSDEHDPVAFVKEVLQHVDGYFFDGKAFYDAAGNYPH